MDLELKGKRARVTGGSKGIGRACAEVLAQEGCEVAIAARYEELFKAMSFGRPARPEEIAWMAAFLASSRSSYTSGCIVTIDGGLANRAD